MSTARSEADRLTVALLTRGAARGLRGRRGARGVPGRELAPIVDVTVHCMGKPRSNAVAHSPWSLLSEANPALQFLSTDLSMAAALEGANLAHSHTWYANLAGHVGGLLHGIPHVVTTHSLEPLRPWKAEQLGGGYALSSWAEKVSIEGAAAVIAVSEGMRADVLSAYPAVDPAKVHVIYNGIDSEQYAPDPATDVVERYGVDLTKPSVVFVGRITPAEGRAGSAAGRRAPRPGGPARALRRRAGHPGAGRRGRRSGGGAAPVPDRGHLAVGDAQQARGHPAAVALDAVRLPVGVRAAGDREPGGDGLRDGGGRVQDRRDPGGRRGRRDRPARAAGRAGAAGRGDQLADPRAGSRRGDGRAGRERAQTLFDWGASPARPRTSTSRSSPAPDGSPRTSEPYRCSTRSRQHYGSEVRGSRSTHRR